jgi:hypothetical protein
MQASAGYLSAGFLPDNAGKIWSIGSRTAFAFCALDVGGF